MTIKETASGIGKIFAFVVLVCAVPLCCWAQGWHIEADQIVVEGDGWEV